MGDIVGFTADKMPGWVADNTKPLLKIRSSFLGAPTVLAYSATKFAVRGLTQAVGASHSLHPTPPIEKD